MWKEIIARGVAEGEEVGKRGRKPWKGMEVMVKKKVVLGMEVVNMVFKIRIRTPCVDATGNLSEHALLSYDNYGK